jgi:hypothetical protein
MPIEMRNWGEWKNPGRLGCHLMARSGSEPAIKDSGSHDRDAMSTPWRPSHSLALAHASISDLIDASLSARGRYWAIAMIPAMVADNASAVVLHVAAQLRAVAQEISRHHLLRIGAPASDVFRVIGETYQLLIRLRRPTMPQQMPDTLDRRLGGLERTNVPKISTGETEQHLLDRAHAHREMEPIKDMPHRLSGRGPYQIGKDGLTVTL